MLFSSNCTLDLLCYFLIDRLQASASLGMELSSIVNFIANNVHELINRSTDKGNSKQDSSDKSNDERGSFHKVNYKKVQERILKGIRLSLSAVS